MIASFCKKTQDNVAALMAGPDGLAICDECVALFSDIIRDKWRKRQIESLKKRLTDQDVSDPEENTPRRFDVELLIIHPTLEPAEITTALGKLSRHAMETQGHARR